MKVLYRVTITAPTSNPEVNRAQTFVVEPIDFIAVSEKCAQEGWGLEYTIEHQRSLVEICQVVKHQTPRVWNT